MKKIVILLLIGFLLLGVGIWWYFQSSGNPFTSDSSVPAVQDLDITRDSLANLILVSTTEGLRLVDPESGEVRTLHPSFDKITTPTQYWGETADRQYWLFMTQETPQPDATSDEGEDETKTATFTYTWYVVNWPKQLVQSLTKTLDASYLQNKIWYSVAWGSGTEVAGAFVAKEKPAVDLQPFTLTTLDLASLSQEEFGVLSASKLDMIGVRGTGTQTELFAQVTRDTTGEVVRRSANSLQNTVISDEGGSFLSADNAHGTQVARYAGEEVELLDLAEPTEVLGTITPLSGTRIGSTQWWSSNSEVFALAHFSTADPAEQTVVFYAPNGSVLYELAVTGSVDLAFSADGTKAVVTATKDSLAAEADITQTDTQFYFVSVFSGEATPASTIPENTVRVLGVL